jgi:hypothetical protein
MKPHWSRGLIWGVLLVSALSAACSRKGSESSGKKLQIVDTESPPPTPSPSRTAIMLLKQKISDNDFTQAIAILESADVDADVSLAVKNGDRRLYGVGRTVLDAPGIPDRASLPQGYRVVAVAGTSDNPGSKYQQRFQMLSRIYAAKYNPLLLARLR